MRVFAALILGLVFLAGGSHPACAFKISPFKTSLDPADGEATQVFHIENNSNEPIAVQVSVQSWSFDAAGVENNADAEDDFAVFPAQLVLPAGSSRGVRVQWLGAESVMQEKAFRVLAEQVPVNLKDLPQAGPRLKFLLRFKAALYITPQGAKDDIQVADFKPEAQGLALDLKNDGRAHALIQQPLLTLTLADGKTLQVSKPKADMLNDMNIHAGAQRRVILPLLPSVAASVRSVHLDYQSGF